MLLSFCYYVTSSSNLQYYIILHVTGKRVAIIIDSDTGRVSTDMIAEMRLRGFYLILGVPNTTHVT